MEFDRLDLEPQGIDFIKGPLGLKIMVIYTEGDLFEIQLQMKVGTFNETLPDELEYAHLLEHLNAQFTSSLNRNQKEIIESIESKGVEWNAFTSSRHTGYYTKGFCDQKMKAPLIKAESFPAKEIEKSDAFWQILDIMLKSYFHFKMDRSLFVQEVKAVNRELSGHLGGNIMTLDEMHTCVLFPGHPISALLIDRIKNMSLQLEDQYKFQQKIMNFRKTHYHPSRTVLTLAVPHKYKETFKQFNFKNYMEYASKGTTFAEVAPIQKPVKKFTIPLTVEKITKIDKGPSYIRASINSIVSRAEDTMIMMSVRLPQVDYNNIEHKTILKAVCFILSTGFSSRLMKRIRTQDGLIYSIQVFPELDRVDSNLNLMTIATSVKSKDAWTAVTHIIEECEALGKKEGNNWITKEELQIFKNYEKRRFQEIALDKTATKWVDHYTTDLLFGKNFNWSDIETFESKYNAVKDLILLNVRTACMDIYKNAEVLITFNNTVDFFKKLFSSEEFQNQ